MTQGTREIHNIKNEFIRMHHNLFDQETINHLIGLNRYGLNEESIDLISNRLTPDKWSKCLDNLFDCNYNPRYEKILSDDNKNIVLGITRKYIGDLNFWTGLMMLINDKYNNCSEYLCKILDKSIVHYLTDWSKLNIEQKYQLVKCSHYEIEKKYDETAALMDSDGDSDQNNKRIKRRKKQPNIYLIGYLYNYDNRYKVGKEYEFKRKEPNSFKPMVEEYYGRYDHLRRSQDIEPHMKKYYVEIRVRFQDIALNIKTNYSAFDEYFITFEGKCMMLGRTMNVQKE